MSYDRVEAVPLIADAAERDDHDEGEDEAYEPKGELKRSGRGEKAGDRSLSLSTILVVSALVASLVSLLFSALNLTSTLQGNDTSGDGTVAVSEAPKKLLVQNLRRPSAYLGMERVPGYRSAKHTQPQRPHESVQVSSKAKGPGVPQEMARVNSRYPSAEFPQDGWVFLTEDVRIPLRPAYPCF